MTINKDTIIGDLIDRDTSCEQIFLSFDMPCLSCPSSRGETIEQACDIHGIELAEILSKLNAHFGS